MVFLFGLAEILIFDFLPQAKIVEGLCSEVQ